MRRHALTVLLAVATTVTLAGRAAAQDARGHLPSDEARRIVAFYNDPRTVHFTGEWRIAPGSGVSGNVAVLDGSLTVAGRVDGDVVVINGDATLADGGTVTGTLTVVGGAIRREGSASVGGEAVAYAERLDYLRRGDRIYADIEGRIEAPPADTSARVAVAEPDTVRDAGREWSEDTAAAGRVARERERGDEWTEGGWTAVRRGVSGDGRADFIVATGQSYNRVEGLPITFGPLVETGGHNPLRLRAMGIFRTEAGPELGPERWGYEARAEQFFGGRREFRVGAGVFRLIDPIEDWHLTKLENGLSTFFLHRDYRDHFEREGWSAFLMVTPRESPFQASLTYRRQSERSEPAGSPFTLFNNNDPWRPQPLSAHGQLSSLILAAKVDTRSSAEDPSSGWYISGQVEQGLNSSLRQPDWISTATADGPPYVIAPGTAYGAFTSGLLDVRRYNRIGPWSRLNLRMIAGGSLDGAPLPPQRQHALGGEGSLPGFPLFSVDCGARDVPVFRADEVSRLAGSRRAAPQYFLDYGCDRFVLFQAEYRGDLSLHLRLAGEENDGETGDEEGFARSLRRGLDTEFGWVLFADAGGGWGVGPRLGDTDTVVDVGAGILIGRLGIYGAVPVSTGGGRFNFFIRLSPRI